MWACLAYQSVASKLRRNLSFAFSRCRRPFQMQPRKTIGLRRICAVPPPLSLLSAWFTVRLLFPGIFPRNWRSDNCQRSLLSMQSRLDIPGNSLIDSRLFSSVSKTNRAPATGLIEPSTWSVMPKEVVHAAVQASKWVSVFAFLPIVTSGRWFHDVTHSALCRRFTQSYRTIVSGILANVTF